MYPIICPCCCCCYLQLFYSSSKHNNPVTSTKYGAETPQYYEGDYTGEFMPYPPPLYNIGQLGGPHGLPIGVPYHPA